MADNDDEVDWYHADVRDDLSEKDWTVQYDEELGIVLDPIHLNAAEYYSEVNLEDQVCDSGTILVYP